MWAFLKGNTPKNRQRLRIAATWLTAMRTGGGCAEDVIIDDATLAFWYEGVPLSFPNLAKWEPTWYTASHAAVFEFLGYEWPPRWTTLSDEIVIDFTGIEGRRELECLFCYLAHWPVEDKDVNQWHSVNLNEGLSRTLGYKSGAEKPSVWSRNAVDHQWVVHHTSIVWSRNVVEHPSVGAAAACSIGAAYVTWQHGSK